MKWINSPLYADNFFFTCKTEIEIYKMAKYLNENLSRLKAIYGIGFFSSLFIYFFFVNRCCIGIIRFLSSALLVCVWVYKMLCVRIYIFVVVAVAASAAAVCFWIRGALSHIRLCGSGTPCHCTRARHSQAKRTDSLSKWDIKFQYVLFQPPMNEQRVRSFIYGEIGLMHFASICLRFEHKILVAASFWVLSRVNL